MILRTMFDQSIENISDFSSSSEIKRKKKKKRFKLVRNISQMNGLIDRVENPHHDNLCSNKKKKKHEQMIEKESI